MTPTRVAVFGGRAPAVLLCALLATSGLEAQGQQDDEVTALLEKPVSPGTLTVLIPHAKDQRVPERWRRSLWNADARVRAVAARLLHVGARPSPQARSNRFWRRSPIRPRPTRWLARFSPLAARRLMPTCSRRLFGSILAASRWRSPMLEVTRDSRCSTSSGR